jgi:hypothetical protein
MPDKIKNTKKSKSVERAISVDNQKNEKTHRDLVLSIM